MLPLKKKKKKEEEEEVSVEAGKLRNSRLKSAWSLLGSAPKVIFQPSCSRK